MPHYYTECGTVGPVTAGSNTVPWRFYTSMTCGYKLSASLHQHDYDKLERRIERRIATMADIAQEFFEDAYRPLGAPPATWELHPDVMFAGEYCGFGIGIDTGFEIPLPPFPIARDLVVTYSFPSLFIGHAKASHLETMLNIERYGIYLEVAKLTGGEINPYSHGYPAPQIEGPEHA